MTDNSFIPNSYQTPNAYCDRLMYLLTPQEWKVLSYAVRRIFGFQKRADCISLSQFMHGTVSLKDGEPLDHGTGLSKPTIIKCLDALMRYRLITKLADNDPSKNDGDLYSLQLDYDQVDYAGLIDRANERATSDLQRTAPGRNSAEQLRRSLPFDLPGQWDLPGGVVNGIDRGWSIALTGGGQSHLPGVVNGIDPQYTDGNTEETKVEGISLPDFDHACALLQTSHPDEMAAASPVLLEADEHPNRLRIKLASVPPSFLDAFKASLQQVSRKNYTLSFETPGTGRQVQSAPQPEPEHRPSAVDESDRAYFDQMLEEIRQDVKATTWRDMLAPAQLVSANGNWTISVPSKKWWETNMLSGLSRMYQRDHGQKMTFVIIQEGEK